MPYLIFTHELYRIEACQDPRRYRYVDGVASLAASLAACVDSFKQSWQTIKCQTKKFGNSRLEQARN